MHIEGGNDPITIIKRLNHGDSTWINLFCYFWIDLAEIARIGPSDMTRNSKD